jgi:hypothetical protein
MTVYKPGDFYIQRTGPREFFLRQNDRSWRNEGRFITTGQIGLFAEGRFVGGERYQLALSPDRLHFYPEWSDPRSQVRLNFTPDAPMTVYFAADLASFLQDGSTLIATSFWDAGPSNIAVTTFEDITTEAFSTCYCIMPDIPDLTAAGLEATLAGELV